MMRDEDWLDLLDKLERTYSDFQMADLKLRKASNKKSKAEAAQEVQSCMNLAIMWIKTYREAYISYLGVDSKGLDRSVVWSELSNPRYFKIEVPKFIEKLKEIV
ncbi:hypothetical protein [Formosa sp. S-31]|uniref:hypothetical protein n=1 Tax=Formosa sp. S-31 TaxID=2790949 RepID=UPI003EBD8EF8